MSTINADSSFNFKQLYAEIYASIITIEETKPVWSLISHRHVNYNPSARNATKGASIIQQIAGKQRLTK